MKNQTKIALIGAGQMGGALAKGWLRDGTDVLSAKDLVIIDPAPSEDVEALISEYSLEQHEAMTLKLAPSVRSIVLAVKPAMIEKVAEFLAPTLHADTMVISIMAGITIKRLTELFGERPIIRAMANTPSAVGAGISVCVSNPAAEDREDEATALLGVAGEVEWIRDERMMGAVTAVSGSGPAYVFLLAEALEGAAFGEGLPRELAEKLARQTIIGAGALLEASGKTPQELRRAVTSPNGTTQAALDVLMGSGGGLPELVRMAVNAAERRSRQMGADSEKP